MLLEIISVLAAGIGIAMSLSHFSQAYKIYKTKSAKDISLVFIFIFTLGAFIWLSYGILIQDIPIILSFAIAVLGTVSVLVLTLRYR